MDRISDPTAVSGLFTEGTPGVTPATIVTAQWLNDMQEEVINVIEDSDGGNLTLDDGSRTQLKEAILAMIANNAGGQISDSQSTLGSDSTTTSTTYVDSGLQVDFTSSTGTNPRYIDGLIDWSIADDDGSKAEAFLDLEYSANGSTWSSLKTFTKSQETNAGKKLVGMSEDTIPSDISTTSTTLANTGLQVDYTAIGAANDRYIEYSLPYLVQRSATNTTGRFELQYSSDGSIWTALRSWFVRTQATGASLVLLQTTETGALLHQASDSTPQYRIQYKCEIGTSSETLNLYAVGAFLRVKEYSNDFIVGKRELTTFTIKHTATDTSPQYRMTHKVTSGDSSTVYAGSVLRVREIDAI